MINQSDEIQHCYDRIRELKIELLRESSLSNKRRIALQEAGKGISRLRHKLELARRPKTCDGCGAVLDSSGWCPNACKSYKTMLKAKNN